MPGVRPNSVAKTTKRFIEQSATFEIFQQAADRLIDGERIGRMICFQSAMGVPGTCATSTMLNLNEAHSAFDQSPGREQLHTKIAAVRLIDTVQRPSFRPVSARSRQLREPTAACETPVRKTRCERPWQDRSDIQPRVVR